MANNHRHNQQTGFARLLVTSYPEHVEEAGTQVAKRTLKRARDEKSANTHDDNREAPVLWSVPDDTALLLLRSNIQQLPAPPPAHHHQHQQCPLSRESQEEETHYQQQRWWVPPKPLNGPAWTSGPPMHVGYPQPNLLPW
jgi:hypothetical protein